MLFGDDELKRRTASCLLEKSPYISTQVVNECSHVMRRKLRWSPERIAEELEVLLILVHLRTADIHHIRLGWKISARYGFSHYDSLIVASALESGCGCLSNFTKNPASSQPNTH